MCDLCLVCKEKKRKLVRRGFTICHSPKVRKIFRKNNLVWTNRAKEKLLKTAKGEAGVKQYRFASKTLFLLDKLRISKALIFFLIKTGLYPSVMYTLQKHLKSD